MNKLWILLAISLALAWIIEERDRELRYRGSRKQERLMTWILMIILAFFCGILMYLAVETFRRKELGDLFRFAAVFLCKFACDPCVTYVFRVQ